MTDRPLDGRRPRRARRRRVAFLVLVALALVVVLFAFVYPTRTYVQQRDQLELAQRRLDVLKDSTRALARENARLETDAEVERRSREDYGFVRSGETPYVLVPAPPPTGWVP